MYSSVKRAHYEHSLSPVSDASKITRDDTVKQNKSMQQKQYRDKEVDSFVELREAIREATGDRENPKTKHETLAKAVQQIKLLHSMNLWLHQQIGILRSRTYFQMNGHVTSPNFIAQEPTMSLHWNSDARPAGMRRTAEITPQNIPHNFFIGVGSGVCDATVPADAQNQTNTIPWNRDGLSYQCTTFGLNPPSTSYDTCSH